MEGEILLFSWYMEQQYGKEDSLKGKLAGYMNTVPPLFKYTEILRWMKDDRNGCRHLIGTFKECYAEYKDKHRESVIRLYKLRQWMRKNQVCAIETEIMLHRAGFYRRT